MSKPNISTAWKKGDPSPNPKGRPKGTGRPVSALRSTLNKLKKLEDKSIENISLVINGENKDENGNPLVSKDQVDLSVKIINMIQAFHKGALAEEQSKIETRNQAESEEEEDDEEVKPPKATFSTKMRPVQ